MQDKYSNKVVLFLDILGFKNIISNTVKDSEDNPDKIKKLYDTLKLIREILGVDLPTTTPSTKRIIQFSDSIVISFDAHEKGEIFNLISDIHFLAKSLIKNGILCRGGIAYGKLIHDDKFIFGPALIAAYDAESKAALFPRIIFDKTIIQLAETYYSNELNSSLLEVGAIATMISKDTDEMLYIDYIEKGEWGNKLIDFNKRQYADKLREIILGGKDSLQPDIKVKYGWMQNKFNKLVNQWKKRYLRNDGIDMGEPEMKEYSENMTKI